MNFMDGFTTFRCSLPVTAHIAGDSSASERIFDSEGTATLAPLRFRSAQFDAGTVRYPPRRDDGNLQLARRRRPDQDQSGYIIFARVARALEAVDAHRLHAALLRLQCMAHRRALVYDGAAVVEEHARDLLWMVARSLRNPHAALNDRARILQMQRR